MLNEDKRVLHLSFHGRVIKHLGIDTYQSPVAALTEIISNCWDADSEVVKIHLPDSLKEGSVIVVSDNGCGMSYKDCEEHYLNVGWERRKGDPSARTAEKRRPVLGRKGIGKFAGFGLAERIRVTTVSKETGEKTEFVLDIRQLQGDSYIKEGGEVEVVQYLGPDKERAAKHGTILTLERLKLTKKLSASVVARSMSRRFLLHQRTADFRIRINGDPIPESRDLDGTEYMFPRDYSDEERPPGIIQDTDGWGTEPIAGGRKVRWHFWFYPEPIQEFELRGIAVFAHGKLVQTPFHFGISGGLSGQWGQEYLAGQVEADYVDELDDDLIATERQRLNWEHPETTPLRYWGEARIKELLVIWRDRRGEARRKQIEDKVQGFGKRLDRLTSHERRTVKTALRKLAAVRTLTKEQFEELSLALLEAWERGRLKDLIDDLANQEMLTAETLLNILIEADVLVALNVAEEIRTKLEAIRGLERLVSRGELESAVRDYIAEKPYLLDPKWETYVKETSIKHILDAAAKESGLLKDIDETTSKKRVDLALRSNDSLLIVEFVRPGRTIDVEHLNKCRLYLHAIRTKIRANTGLGINPDRIAGLVVADRIDKKAVTSEEIKALKKIDIDTFDWSTLLEQSKRAWRDFLDIVRDRAPEDERIERLVVEEK